MDNDEKQLEAIQDIRKMMKESSKFLSLSGLAGVAAGSYALVGAYAANSLLQTDPVAGYIADENPSALTLVFRLSMIGMAVLTASVVTAYVLSAQKARRLNQVLFDHTSRKVFWSMAVPLAVGGVFCFSLLYHQEFLLLCPAMLLFYGMALLNSSKYTMPDIRYLALLQICLGLLAGFIPEYGLLIWSAGFGVLHIIYGLIMWSKYDRQI